MKGGNDSFFFNKNRGKNHPVSMKGIYKKTPLLPLIFGKGSRGGVKGEQILLRVLMCREHLQGANSDQGFDVQLRKRSRFARKGK